MILVTVTGRPGPSEQVHSYPLQGGLYAHVHDQVTAGWENDILFGVLLDAHLNIQEQVANTSNRVITLVQECTLHPQEREGHELSDWTILYDSNDLVEALQDAKPCGQERDAAHCCTRILVSQPGGKLLEIL